MSISKVGVLYLYALQESLLAGQGALIDTPFTYKGFVGDFWLLQETLPRASMDPDPAKIDIIKNNPTWNQVTG